MAGRGLLIAGSSSYPGLTRTPQSRGVPTYALARGKAAEYQPGRNVGGQDFNRRFGIARLYERNGNLLSVLNDPHNALQTVNDELYDTGNRMAVLYEERLKQFRGLGLSEEDAIARADIMTGRELENEIAFLSLKYPYAMGGAAAGGWDPVSAALMQGPHGAQMQKFATGMQAINSGGLGVSSVGGIKKGGEKRRLKKKFKKRYNRKRA